MKHTGSPLLRPAWCLGLALAAAAGAVSAQDKPVYRCPGNLYTDALSAKEASDRGCKTLEGAPITVIQSQAPRAPARAAAPGGAAGGGGERVSSDAQRARDAESRRILEAELRKEEEALASLNAEYKNGQPDRLGNERNYQKYLDRVAELKDAITRKEADIASIRRELGKLAPAPAVTSSGTPLQPQAQ